MEEISLNMVVALKMVSQFPDSLGSRSDWTEDDQKGAQVVVMPEWTGDEQERLPSQISCQSRSVPRQPDYLS